MKLSEIIQPACIRIPVNAAEKVGAIRELVDLLGEAGQISDSETVFHAVLEREQTRSTGIGKGLAVPHGKSPACSKLVMALGRPATPIDFGSRDDRPVDVVVLLVSPPDQTGPHIQALARVSRLMLNESFRKELAAAESADAAYEAILRYDAELG